MTDEPHAITQARQRHGLELTLDDLDNTLASLCAGGTLVKRECRAAGPSEWRWVKFRGAKMLVVWSPLVRKIITVLPSDAAANDEEMARRRRMKWRRKGRRA